MKIGNNVKVLTGTPVDIECQASGIPQPSYTWRNGKVLLEGSGAFSIGDDGRRFSILSIEKGDAGNYTCIAENDAGRDSKSVSLKVYGK